MTITYPLTMPNNVGVTRVRLFSISAVAINESPYTFFGQKQIHQGQRWGAEISLPVMERDQAEEWQCFLHQLNGVAGTFYLGDPFTPEPRGNWSGIAVVDGAGQTGSSINLKGLVEGATIAPGDKFQIGYRLYRYIGIDTAVADSSGEVTLDIFPRLRESPSDGTAVITESPQGLFRLADNQNDIYNSHAMMYYEIGVAAVEEL